MRANLQTFNSVSVRAAMGLVLFVSATIFVAPRTSRAQATPSSSEKKPSILHPEDMAMLMPEMVFFRGQKASVQMRNSSGIKFPDGMLILTALVDTSGYSSGLQQKYQGYFMSEATIKVNGHVLAPGAYGVGFLEENRFIVMDIGAHDLFTVNSIHDPALKRPTPLQIVAEPAPDRYRLYFGRNYVVLSRPQGL